MEQDLAQNADKKLETIALLKRLPRDVRTLVLIEALEKQLAKLESERARLTAECLALEAQTARLNHRVWSIEQRRRVRACARTGTWALVVLSKPIPTAEDLGFENPSTPPRRRRPSWQRIHREKRELRLRVLRRLHRWTRPRHSTTRSSRRARVTARRTAKKAAADPDGSSSEPPGERRASIGGAP